MFFSKGELVVASCFANAGRDQSQETNRGGRMLNCNGVEERHRHSHQLRVSDGVHSIRTRATSDRFEFSDGTSLSILGDQLNLAALLFVNRSKSAICECNGMSCQNSIFVMQTVIMPLTDDNVERVALLSLSV